MNEQEFKNRTKQLALRIIQLVNSLPNDVNAKIIGRQLLRSGTSVGANYRSACRAKSTAELINKLSIVEEEADESLYWLELLIEGEMVKETKLSNLIKDMDEVVSMTETSINTLRLEQILTPKSEFPNPKSL
jgi:four helix bundle protein